MSSKRRLRRKQCERKVRHPNRTEAKDALRKLITKHRPRAWLHTYRCQFCRGWHIGRQPNSQIDYVR